MIGNPLAVILLTSIGLGMMIYDGMSREIYDFDIVRNQAYLFLLYDLLPHLQFLFDLENNYNIVADSRLVKDKYNKAFRNFSDFYKKECLRDKIDYNLISTSDSLDKTLLQYLIRRSQINK